MAVDTTLVAAVRQALAAAADPPKAAGMRAYLKSELPCHGVYSPAMRAIWRDVFGRCPLDSTADWQDTVRALWDEAGYREERYAAIALTGHRRYRPYQVPAVLPLYDHLVVTGAWWDLVDGVATGRVGPLVRAFPDELAPVMRAWAADEDLWRRRTAVLHQVGAKDRTDVRLLQDCLEPNLERREFFLRKAVGWALRDHAHTDPDWVRRYVRDHGDRLSPLSRREAVRHL
jgi:3-methyladenine DNA glycosylase AlkD